MKCIIVDDESIARRGLRKLINENADLECVAEFGEPEEALEFLSSHDIDLAFLDIEMPGMNGIELAEKLPESCSVIFITAYTDYAISGFEVEALDYLVKPLESKRFHAAVDKALRYAALLEQSKKNQSTLPEPDYIIVKADRRYVRVPIADIRYVEGLKDYVIIYLASRKIVTRLTVKGILDLLPSDKFIRVNRSYIVNIAAIDAFDNNDVVCGSTEIAIGATYREEVFSRLLK